MPCARARTGPAVDFSVTNWILPKSRLKERPAGVQLGPISVKGHLRRSSPSLATSGAPFYGHQPIGSAGPFRAIRKSR